MEEARGEHRTHEVLFCTNCHAADSGHSDGSMQNRELTQQPTDREEERAGKGKAGCNHLVMELGSQPQAPWEVRPCRKPLFAASWRREMCSGRGDLHAFPPFWPSLWVPYGTEQKLQESKTQPWESHGPSLGGKSCTTWDQYSVCNTGEGAPAWMDPLDSDCMYSRIYFREKRGRNVVPREQRHLAFCLLSRLEQANQGKTPGCTNHFKCFPSLGAVGSVHFS